MSSKYSNKHKPNEEKELSKVSSPYKNRKIYNQAEVLMMILKTGANIKKDTGINTLTIRRNSLGNKNLGKVSFLKNYCGISVLFIG